MSEHHISRHLVLAGLLASVCIANVSPAKAQTRDARTEPVAVVPETSVATGAQLAGIDSASTRPMSRDVIAGYKPVTYDSMALRIESHGGAIRVVRGVRGPVVWSHGLLFTSGNLEHIVAASPAALVQAQVFNAKHRRGTVNLAIGIGAWVASAFIAGSHPNNGNGYKVALPLGFAGVAMMYYSHRDLNAASTALSRSVLLYNNDIPR